MSNKLQAFAFLLASSFAVLFSGCQTGATSGHETTAYQGGVRYSTYNGQELQFPVRPGDPHFVPPRLVGGVSALYARVGYSSSLRQQHIGGVVVTAITISADGRCTGARIVKGVYPTLNEGVCRAWLASSFEPARSSGKPVECHYTIPITFIP